MAAKKALKKAGTKLKAKAKSARAKASVKASALKAKTAKAVRAKAPVKPKGVQAIPAGMPTLVPNLTIRGASEAIEFYKQALGAKELARMMMPGSTLVWHAELKVGDSVLYINDEMPGMGQGSSAERPTPTSMWLWSKNAEQAFNSAVSAGAKVVMPLMDQFWGDRMGMVQDRWGITWAFSQHVKDLSPQEMQRAGEEFARQNAQPQGAPPPQGGSNGPQSTTGGAMA